MVPELRTGLMSSKSMAMRFHGNVCGEVRVNFLALFASKTHIFMCGALKFFRIVRANVRLNIRNSKSSWSLTVPVSGHTPEEKGTLTEKLQNCLANTILCNFSGDFSLFSGVPSRGEFCNFPILGGVPTLTTSLLKIHPLNLVAGFAVALRKHFKSFAAIPSVSLVLLGHTNRSVSLSHEWRCEIALM